MGMYKEADHFFNGWASKQERIYDDACDVGIPVSGFDDRLCVNLAGILSGRGGYEHYALDSIKKHRSKGNYSDNKTIMYSEVIVYLPWESDHGQFRCTRWIITYNNDPMKKKQFISFSPSSVFATEDKIWEDA